LRTTRSGRLQTRRLAARACCSLRETVDAEGA
jgi:hypothetical protein